MNINLGVQNNKLSKIENKVQVNKTVSKLTNNSKTNQFVNDNFKNNNDNLKFNTQKIKFFKEDEEKMAKMSLQDKINYKIKLKSENKYTLA